MSGYTAAKKLFMGITEINDELITKAFETDKKLSFRRKFTRFAVRTTAAAAAAIVAVVGIGRLLAPENLLLAAAAQIPDKTIFETTDYEQRREIFDNADTACTDLNGFYRSTMRTFLSGTEENSIFSPVGVYNGLSIAAEISGGNTRAQIMRLLGASDIETLRSQTRDLWLSDYRTNYKAKQITANSLWLDEDITYNADTLDILAREHYASTFSGKMGTEQYDRALRGWLNGQTDGLLKEYADKVTMKPPEGFDIPVLEIASTVNFYGKWNNEFDRADTYSDIFHTPDGDVSCDFMHQKEMQGRYFWGQKFSGCVMSFKDNGAGIRFILPDEGYDTDDLLNDPEAMYFLADKFPVIEEKMPDDDSFGSKFVYIDLSVPKFDIAENADLKEGLKELGVTDMFDMEKADFTPLTDVPLVAASKISTASRVMIDEEGCKAVSYIEIGLSAGSAAPPDDHAELKLDRPFLFTIFTQRGQPLFTGVVRYPDTH